MESVKEHIREQTLRTLLSRFSRIDFPIRTTLCSIHVYSYKAQSEW